MNAKRETERKSIFESRMSGKIIHLIVNVVFVDSFKEVNVA